MERIGIFVGSFDPFTIGHDSIVRRALPLFDRLVIGVGVNEKKRYMLTAEERVETIRGLYDGEKKISVEQYSDLTVDFAQRHGAQFIVKGVRSVKDFEFEREQADINRRLTGIETVVFYALPGMDSVSSTVVRELKNFGRSVDSFLPKKHHNTSTQRHNNIKNMITYNVDGVKMPKIKKRETTAWIRAVAATYGYKVGEVGYMFVDDEKILEVNNEYLGHDYYTDVITFDYDEPGIVSGDIVISLDTVRTNAEKFGKQYDDELHRVIIHGILHLCGINDKGPGEREIMEDAENKALAMLQSLC